VEAERQRNREREKEKEIETEDIRERFDEKRVSFDWSIEDTCWQPRHGPALWLCISLRTHSGTPTSPMTESSGIVNGGTVGGWDEEKAIEIEP